MIEYPSNTIAHLSDILLGVFSKAPNSERLDHAVRYLSTWSGSDKFFMTIQYALKLVIPFLELRARLQHRMGTRPAVTSSVSKVLEKLYDLISDSRMLWRFWGLLPIFQWLTSLERSPPPTRALLNIERIQGWSMLLYYPLEHLYYLRSKGILPSTLNISLPLLKTFTVQLNTLKLALWSTRAWLLYVVLQFGHLKEDAKLLEQRTRTVSKTKGEEAQSEKASLSRRWDALWSEFFSNVGNLPLSIHWSLEKGLFKNEIWVGVFGLIASLASIRSGWKATTLPSSPLSTPVAAETEMSMPMTCSNAADETLGASEGSIADVAVSAEEKEDSGSFVFAD